MIAGGSNLSLSRIIRDAIAQKRMIKWGYVRQFGGLYPMECDSIAAHSNAVAALAVIIATEVGATIEERCGVTLNIGEICVMAVFHDYGEGRSGDTGASSYSIRGTCNLHFLEREGLSASLTGLAFHDDALRIWDDYRAYRTLEAVIVHVADNLEGFEKALHAGRGAQEVTKHATGILAQNLDIYSSRHEISDKLAHATRILVEEVLLPGAHLIAEAYGVDLNLAPAVGN